MFTPVFLVFFLAVVFTVQIFDT